MISDRKMGRLLNVAKWGVTLGRDPQNFLGAGWITKFLSIVPDRSKKKWALRILALSPHYFIDGDNPEFAGMDGDKYLRTSFEIISDSRKEISEKIIKPFMRREDVALDFGCGPGFLARHVAEHVSKVIAADISKGAIECARILNPAANIDYVTADQDGLAEIPDGSIDAVYSYAVVQHLTREVLDNVLWTIKRKLMDGGRLILHVQLPDATWRTEAEWLADSTLQGKMKFRYGLHCFGRSENEYRELLEKQGFEEIRFETLEALLGRRDGELASQRIVTATLQANKG